MKRIWQFDYIKAMAIILVIINHATAYGNISDSSPVFPYLVTMAVPFFMIISGYMFALSTQRLQIKKLSDYYKWNLIVKKLSKIYIPFTIIYIFELIVIPRIENRAIDIKEAIHVYIMGGWGPGSYYIPMLVEMIVIAPILYWIIKKRVISGSILIIGVQLFFEILVKYSGVPEQLYRLLIFRYFVFIIAGMLLFQYFDRIKIRYIILPLCLGAGYIWAVAYGNYQPFLFKYWIPTSMPTVLWTFAVIIIAFRYFPHLPPKVDRVITYIGKNTYYIYLIQMMFFQFGIGTKRNAAEYYMISTTVCIALGLLYEYMLNKSIEHMEDKNRE